MAIVTPRAGPWPGWAEVRSLLVVPGGSRERLDEALESGADALIVDLADSVAPAGTEAARKVASRFLAETASRDVRPVLLVRVNGLATGLTDRDLDPVMRSAPDGIVLPRTVGGRDVQDLSSKLAVAEAEYGIHPGRTRILPIATDTAKGVLAVGTLAGSSRRLIGIAWASADLSADIGAQLDRDADDGRRTDPCRHARLMTLLAAAAAEVDAVDAASTAVREEDGLARDCREARRDGFAAKMAIHPAQVRVINETFACARKAADGAPPRLALASAAEAAARMRRPPGG